MIEIGKNEKTVHRGAMNEREIGRRKIITKNNKEMKNSEIQSTFIMFVLVFHLFFVVFFLELDQLSFPFVMKKFNDCGRFGLFFFFVK